MSEKMNAAFPKLSALVGKTPQPTGHLLCMLYVANGCVLDHLRGGAAGHIKESCVELGHQLHMVEGLP